MSCWIPLVFAFIYIYIYVYIYILIYSNKQNITDTNCYISIDIYYELTEVLNVKL